MRFREATTGEIKPIGLDSLFYHWHLLLPHVAPEYAELHWQRYWLIPSTHFPPLEHGLLRHSFSAEIREPTHISVHAIYSIRRIGEEADLDDILTQCAIAFVSVTIIIIIVCTIIMFFFYQRENSRGC